MMDIRDTISDARERITVVTSQPVSMKVSLIAMVATFALGFYASYRMDLTGFRDFRAQAAVLVKQREEENLLLAEALERLRSELETQLEKQKASDKGFQDLLDKPGKTHCLVPVEDINPIIAEAGR